MRRADLAVTAVAVLVLGGGGTWSVHAMNQEDDRQRFCSLLEASLVEEPEWACVREGTVVYP